MKEPVDLASYLLGERSELRPLIEAIASGVDELERERAAVEYLLVLAAARQAARGERAEARALWQVRSQYARVYTRDLSEHARYVQELHSSLQGGSHADLSTALKLLGLYHRKRAEFKLARACFAVAVEVAKHLEDPIEQLNSLFWLGVVERYLGRLDQAESVHREQLDKARAAGVDGQAVLARENLGLVKLRRGQVADARRQVLKALNEARQLGDPELEGYCHHALMVVEIEAGRPGEAASCGWEAYRRYESVDQRMRALQDCGVLLYQWGMLEAARAAFEIVVARHSDTASQFRACTGLADVAAATGDRLRFEALASALLSERTVTGMPFELVSCYRTVGDGYANFGEVEKARRYLQQGLALAREKGFEAEASELEELLTELGGGRPSFVPLETSTEERDRLIDVGRSIMAERARAVA